MTNANWCVGDGSAVQCNQSAPVVSETDPEVGTLTASKWCAANAGGTAIDCTQSAPGLPTCSEGEGLVYTSGAWACQQPSPTFDFTDVVEQTINTQVSSNIVLLAGFSGSVSVSVTGDGSPQWRSCSTGTCGTVIQTWTSGSGTISGGNYIQLRLTTAATYNTASVATVTVGSGIADWSATTNDYKVVFITSTTYKGNLGGTSGADAKCATRAIAGGLTGTYKAWVSISAAKDPESAFTHSTKPYVLPNGTKVADDWTDLTDGSLDNAINRNEFGNSYSGSTWTATTNAGQYDNVGETCANWASSSSGQQGMEGQSSTTNWSSTGSDSYCNQTLSLFCFAQ